MAKRTTRKPRSKPARRKAPTARTPDEVATRGIDPEVIFEQHHAMNWLAFKDEEDWDNIATDS